MTGVRHRLSAASCRTHVLVLLLLGIGSGLLPCTVDAVRPRRKSGGRGSKPSVSLSDTLEPDRSSANAERPSSSTLRMMMGGSLPSKRAQDVRMEQFEATALHETATQQLRQRCLEGDNEACSTVAPQPVKITEIQNIEHKKCPIEEHVKQRWAQEHQSFETWAKEHAEIVSVETVRKRIKAFESQIAIACEVAATLAEDKAKLEEAHNLAEDGERVRTLGRALRTPRLVLN
eukprot:scaffold4518_cov410-Prasinococcus_capsulatus_cf.AAC.37